MEGVFDIIQNLTLEEMRQTLGAKKSSELPERVQKYLDTKGGMLSQALTLNQIRDGLKEVITDKFINNEL